MPMTGTYPCRSARDVSIATSTMICCGTARIETRSPAGVTGRMSSVAGELINEERWRRASFCVKVGDGERSRHVVLLSEVLISLH